MKTMSPRTTIPSDGLIVVKPITSEIRDDASVASLSSTLTADAVPRKILSAPSFSVRLPSIESIEAPTTPTKRSSPQSSVRFNEANNRFHENTVMCSEDCAEMWYSTEEFGRFKREIIQTVKTLLRHESRNPSPGSIGNILENTYVCCFECEEETQQTVLPQELQAAIKNQYRHNDQYLLGLERLIVKRIGKDRNELRKCLMEIVQELQSQGQQGLTDPEQRAVMAENIARVSAEATRASRLFAQHLGSAQVPYLLTSKPTW